MVQPAVDLTSDDRLDGVYTGGVDDSVLSTRTFAPSMLANDGVVGSSRNEDEVLPAGLSGRLVTGVFRFDRDIQTPSISTPLSNARTPKGASILFAARASITAGVGSRSLASTVE